jgi:hypothetical protein
MVVAFVISTIPAWSPDIGVNGPRLGLLAFFLFIIGFILVWLRAPVAQRR